MTDPQEAFVNPDKPNANSRVVYENTLGTPTEFTYITHLEPDGSTGFYFGGFLNGETGVGRLDPLGNLVWFITAGYRVYEMHVRSSGGLVLVGSHDLDGDGDSDIGHASSISPDGVLRGSLSFQSDTSDVWVTSLAAISDTAFVLVGGEKTSAQQNPFVASIALGSDGQLAEREAAVVSSLANRFFDNVVIEPQTSPSAPEFYTLSDNWRFESDTRFIAVHKVLTGAGGLASSAVQWGVDISNSSGLGNNAEAGGSLRLVNEALYFVGWADSPKESRPSNGGFWQNGIAASVSTAGQLNWITEVELTNHSEYFTGLQVIDGALFAVGRSGWFSRSGATFGYGLISKFGLSDGEPLWHMTMGNEAYASVYDGVAIGGDTGYCAGFTRLSGGDAVGWFAQVDLGNSAPVNVSRSVHEPWSDCTVLHSYETE